MRTEDDLATQVDYNGDAAGANGGGRWRTPVESRDAPSPCTTYTGGRELTPMESRRNCLLSSGSGVRFLPGAPRNLQRNQAVAAATPASHRMGRSGLTFN